MASMRAGNVNPSASAGGGTLNGAQNGLNVTVTPNVVEMGGNLIRDTLIEGFDPLKIYSFEWNGLSNWNCLELENKFEVESKTIADRDFRQFMNINQILFRLNDAGVDNKRVFMNLDNLTPHGFSVGVGDEAGTVNYARINLEESFIELDNSNAPSGTPNYKMLNLPVFADTATANADASLLADSFFRVIGDQVVYQKD